MNVSVASILLPEILLLGRMWSGIRGQEHNNHQRLEMTMENLKMLFGREKGHIAEILARKHLQYAYRPRELPVTLLNQFKIQVPDDTKRFLAANWMSIDLFGFELESYVVKNLILYEVKARNHYTNPANMWQPRITSNCHRLYSQALERGYVVKYVEVVFCDNWNYDITICDLHLDAFRIDDGLVQYRKKGTPEREMQ